VAVLAKEARLEHVGIKTGDIMAGPFEHRNEH
jgi:hypothetical protein